MGCVFDIDLTDNHVTKPDLQPAATDSPTAQGAPASVLASIDTWMASNPWHPRVVPFIVYLLFLPIIQLANGITLYAYPALYIIQTAVVAALLWRYRKLLPELTVRFHWLAIPTGVGLCAAWIALGLWMANTWPSAFGPSEDEHYFTQAQNQSHTLYAIALGVRLLGMSLLVPLFEELFVRSACLRGMYSARKTGLGILQMLEDLPIIGDWLIDTKLGQRTANQPAMFTQQLREWPVGKLTAFGVVASTLVFMVHHVPRDWPGTIACGLVWCALVWYTNRPGSNRKLGIGPIAWSHGITNALLWAWCVYYNDWQFM